MITTATNSQTIPVSIVILLHRYFAQNGRRKQTGRTHARWRVAERHLRPSTSLAARRWCLILQSPLRPRRRLRRVSGEAGWRGGGKKQAWVAEMLSATQARPVADLSGTAGFDRIPAS